MHHLNYLKESMEEEEEEEEDNLNHPFRHLHLLLQDNSTDNQANQTKVSNNINHQRVPELSSFDFVYLQRIKDNR